MGKEEMTTYHRHIPNTWWLKRKPYILFMIRELTSIFVAGYCVFLLILVFTLGEGHTSYNNLIATLKSPTSVVLHLVSLAFVLYHTITWFNLTPKILVLYRGEDRVPTRLVAGIFYVGWIGISIIIIKLILGI